MNQTEMIKSMKEDALSLQWKQLEHDKFYHADVMALSTAGKLRHMTLHFAKYYGSLLTTLNEPEQYNKILVDSFIICLASANILNISLSQELSDLDTKHFMFDYATTVGRLAKSYESIDHLEAYDFRNNFKKDIVNMFFIVIKELAEKNINIKEAYRKRMSEIESKNIFYGFNILSK